MSTEKTAVRNECSFFIKMGRCGLTSHVTERSERCKCLCHGTRTRGTASGWRSSSASSTICDQVFHCPGFAISGACADKRAHCPRLSTILALVIGFARTVAPFRVSNGSGSPGISSRRKPNSDMATIVARTSASAAHEHHRSNLTVLMQDQMPDSQPCSRGSLQQTNGPLPLQKVHQDCT
jgi:hypothetical protein